MVDRQLNLDGVPEEVARAIEVVVQATRKPQPSSPSEGPRPIELPVWKLGLVGKLRREDYYNELD